MTLAQLRYTIAIAKAGSMNEAAKNLYISQPSLSTAIRELETETGVEIFRRTNRGIAVTPAGEEFLGYARQVVEQYELMEAKYISKEQSRKKFSVSMQHYTFAVNAFVELVKQFGMDEYEFAVHETKTHQVIEDVRNFKSEVGILYVNDSKKLSEKKREELFDVIKEDALSYGIGIVSPERIDEINILQATYEAMREAVNKLSVKPDILLNDAVTIPGIDVKQVPIIKGDAKSLSIASASILAKVTRDRLMVEYDSLYPEYCFAKHKGYGTKVHIEAIKEYGPCPIHRRTFIKNFI